MKKIAVLLVVLILLFTGCANSNSTEDARFYSSLINMSETEVTERLGTPDSVETDSGNSLAKDYKGYTVYIYSRSIGDVTDVQLMIGIREKVVDLVRIAVPAEKQNETDIQNLKNSVEALNSAEAVMYSDDQSFIIEFVAGK